jgi:TM2 domain-containing membrane protein YozV
MTQDQITQLQTVSQSSRGNIMNYYTANKKTTSSYALLALFLGGLGAHHFYLGRTLAGVLSVIFFWTFIPAICALVELMFSSVTVRNYNNKVFAQALAIVGT